MLRVLAVLWVGAAAAQDPGTLADLKRDLDALRAQIAGLEAELAPSGRASAPPTSGPALVRLDGIETEMRRIAGEIERVEARVRRVVADGTQRVSDLEFRLTEAVGGDLSSLGETPPLGGETGPAPAVADTAGPELAVGERSGLREADQALAAGDARAALAALDRFQQAFPVSPLAPEAALLRGRAQIELGDVRAAARAFLDSFSADTDGPAAPEALFRLGLSLIVLNQREEGCIALQRVTERFPGSEEATRAAAERTRLSCT